MWTVALSYRSTVTSPSANGFNISGDIDATSAGSATITISGFAFNGNQTGINVSSNTNLDHLVIENSHFEHNKTNGVGMGSGAFGEAVNAATRVGEIWVVMMHRNALFFDRPTGAGRHDRGLDDHDGSARDRSSCGGAPTPPQVRSTRESRANA